MRYLSIIILLISFQSASAAYYCGVNDMHFVTLQECSVNCSDACMELSAADGTGACSSQYSNFLYDRQTGTTYAVTRNAETWNNHEQFIAVSQHKSDIVKYLASLSGKTLWLGLYDQNMSTAYNTTNKSNYVWIDGTQLTYNNFASGQPDNMIEGADIGAVTVYGEHWVYSDTEGQWHDDGEHVSYGANYYPKHYHIAEFQGMLDCVAGLPKTDESVPVDIIDAYCTNDSQNCTLCVHDNKAEQCINGTDVNGLYAAVCPGGIIDCVSTLQNPLCPNESVYNPSKNKCVKTPECRSDFKYNSSTQRCEKSRDNKCSLTGIEYSSYSQCQNNCIKHGTCISSSECGSISIVSPDLPSLGVVDISASCSGDGINVRFETGLSDYNINLSLGETRKYHEGSFNNDNIDREYASYISYQSDNKICFKKYESENGHVQNIINCDNYVVPAASEYCPLGNYVCNNGVCTQGFSCISTVCPTGSYTDEAVCYMSPVCPSGMLYNNGECVADSECPSGYTFNSFKNKCEKATCQTSQNSCVNISPTGSEPNYKCSPYNCLDPNNSSYADNSEDTQEGSNDKVNDGEKDDEGQCLGQIYIFNGGDRRCRQPGTQTGFSDCCKKGESWFGYADCAPNEQALSALRDWGELDGQCHYVGDYCAEKWGICPACVCVQKKKTYCCFGSPLTRITAEQGREQLGFNFGTAKSPECRGFTPEEFQELDFSKIDFSEWIETYVQPEMMDSINGTIVNTFENITIPEIDQ